MVTQHLPFGPKHVVREAQADVAALCAPLFQKLDLNYFHYGRFYRDGSLAVLYSRMDWHDCFYKNKFKTTVPLANQEIKFGQYQVCLWRGSVSDDTLSTARNFTNLDHPINVTIAHKDYFEGFAFATRTGNDSIINTYFNNMDLLLNFTRYFKDQAAELIEKSEQNRFILPKAQQADGLKILDNVSSALTMVGAYGEVAITFKEFEALRLLCRGLTIREIAYRLKRSARTIEMHFNHLKAKLGCKRKSQLIELALENNINGF